jgi:hypothetical protein
MVLLLLNRRRVLRPFLSPFLACALLTVGSIGASSVAAAERTFALSPAELVGASDLFGARALSRSAILGKAVGVKRGAVRFAKSTCPSLLADPTRKLTRVRVLGGPLNAPLVVGRSLAPGLTIALIQMNAATWLSPASGKTRQSQWSVEAPASDVVGFATDGFAIGDLTGALGSVDAGNGIPGFRFTVNLAGADLGTGPAEIAMQLTTELPSKRPGRPGKRIDCIAVVALLPADLPALRALVNAAGLTDVTTHRLQFILDSVQTFLDRSAPDRAARQIRSFALEVAQRTESEIPPASAEAMINRANLAAEALGF